MKQRIVRTRARALFTILAVAALGLLQSSSAWAYAEGYDTWGSFCVKDVCLPGGEFGYVVRGSGNNVTTIEGFGVAPRVCNWHMDFAFYDGNNRRVANYTQATVYNCTSRPTRRVNVNRRMPNGRTCGRLYINNVHKATVCHAINP